MSDLGPKVSIILPVRNEPTSVLVISRMLNAYVPFTKEIIVVVDSEQDSTNSDQIKALENVSLVVNTMGRGVWNAVVSGVNKSNSENIVIYLADELTPALSLEEIIKALVDGQSFVSATRYAGQGKRIGGHILGRKMSKVANGIFPFLTGIRLTDVTTGIKGFKKDFFFNIEKDQTLAGWSMALFLSLEAVKNLDTIVEVPIVSIDRLYGGHSTFSFFSWSQSYLKLYSRGILELRSKRKEVNVITRVPFFWEG